MYTLSLHIESTDSMICKLTVSKQHKQIDITATICTQCMYTEQG